MSNEEKIQNQLKFLESLHSEITPEEKAEEEALDKFWKTEELKKRVRVALLNLDDSKMEKLAEALENFSRADKSTEDDMLKSIISLVDNTNEERQRIHYEIQP